MSTDATTAVGSQEGGQCSHLDPQPIDNPTHCTGDEYRDFLKTLGVPAPYQRRRDLFRQNFVAQWSDVSDWYFEPLKVRIGRLHGETQKTAWYPTSYRAHSYLLYLALTDRIRLDYPFLLSVVQLEARPVAEPLGLTLGVPSLIQQGLSMGYSRCRMRSAVGWIMHRLVLHTGVRDPDQVRLEHLDELRAAIETYQLSRNVDRFHGLTTDKFCQTRSRAWLGSVNLLQLLLYHRGLSVPLPRIHRSGSPPCISPRPDLQAIVDRWLNIKRQTLAKTTVDHMAVSLRRFVAHIDRLLSSGEGFADVTAEHLTSFLHELATTRRTRTGRPLSIAARRASATAVAGFLSDGHAWEWPNFPAKPVLDYRDLPRLPQRVPRFIPAQELDRLMAAIREITCPFQRAALLVARWSGARRGEIVRLRLDCLDQYPDGTARLRIPAGKTLKERMVPLHEEAAAALRSVIRHRDQADEEAVEDSRTGDRVRYVFFRRGVRISADYLFQKSLRETCLKAGLVDKRGRPTITAHRFRHSVGTQLAERGAKLHTIMSILGHESPHMAMVYARISDEAVLNDYRSVLGPGAAIAGPAAEAIRSGTLSKQSIHWLQTNFLKTELELGHCLRLPSEGPCECDLYLTCAKFVTTKAYAPRLRERHRLEQSLIDDAKSRGWVREVERHRGIACRIEGLLAELGEPTDGT